MRRLQMKICRNGITRAVLLIGPYAVKFPRWRYGWNKFLRGLLSNMSERQFSCMKDEFRLCPTIWTMWGGFVSIMPRCQPLTDFEWSLIEQADVYPPDVKWHGMSCDFKRDNFGTLNGRIVLLDYGELT